MADSKSLLLYLCIFGCLWSYAVAQTPPEILVAPQPQLVPFNLDAMVTFNCTVRATELIWQVNTAQLVDEDDKMDARDLGIFPDVMNNMDGTLSGTLRINVSESNTMANMTRIVCIAVGSSTLIRTESDLVTLRTFAIPEPPRNFQLTPSTLSNTLTIRWDPPTNTPPDVPTTHRVDVVNSVTGDDYPGFPKPDLMLDTTSLTFNEQDTNCTLFRFWVTATNNAGTSEPSVMNETIPISPDVTPINDFLSAQNGISVSFSGDDVSITLIFMRARTCSLTNFPITVHTINLILPETTSFFRTVDRDGVITVTIDQRNVSLLLDTFYMISVTASNGITMRTSEAFPVYTTDVQAARVTYIDLDNRVFLTCSFGTGSTARGCIFIFTLRDESERFYVTRDPGEQCNTTINNAGSYDTIQVVDWESNSLAGTLPRTIVPELDLDEGRFSGFCPLPDSGLSGGEIAGIVIGIVGFVLLVAAIVVVLIVVYFMTRRNTEYGEEEDKRHFWINLPGVHMSLVAKPSEPGDDLESEDEAERLETTPLTSPPPTAGAHGSEPFEESNVRLIASHALPPKPEGDIIPMGPVSTGDTGSGEKSMVRGDSVTADMGMAVSPGSPPPSLLPGTATVISTEKSYGGPLATLRSIDSATGTSVKPQKVGEMDLSNPKNMKIRLNPRVVRKVLKRRSPTQEDTKKLLLYAE